MAKKFTIASVKKAAHPNIHRLAKSASGGSAAFWRRYAAILNHTAAVKRHNRLIHC
jgi:hypothetical protein